MGPAGAGALAQVVNGALGNRARFDEMREFFAGVGAGDTAGIWSDTPRARPEFRETFKRKLEKQLKARRAEEPV
jgi:chlorophyllide a reductase subunit Y